MDRPKPLVSEAEVNAALDILNQMSVLAAREQPIPPTLMRILLEEAAMVRVGMIPAQS